MKIMALHLPAFHQIPENDEWWGEGFTEWDNVRGGIPYYRDHCQPVRPIDENYYDLSRPDDLLGQIRTAKKYGVDGFVFYHYWFGDNRQIFEKPAEILRDEISEDFCYCFCWANESWITTWHGMDPNTLIEQRYGGQDDWKSHIDYLLTFFQDDRYCRIGDRPVLFIYKPNEIPQYEKMITFWNGVLQAIGIGPIYVIEYISSKNKKLHSEASDAVMEFEPLYSTFFDIGVTGRVRRAICKLRKCIDFQSYDRLWRCILTRSREYDGKPIVRSCFVAWDNSPRKERASMIVRGSSPEKFKDYFSKLLTSQRKGLSDELTIINAWNEWSEGAFLEASEEYGYSYLEALKMAVQDSLENCSGGGE